MANEQPIEELSPESESVIRELLEAGAYPSRSALLEEGVRALGRHRELKRLIEEGMNSGPSLKEDEVFPEIEAAIEQATREKAGSGR